MIAAGAVRVVAATLPAGVRDRYREEWLADVAGARELGASPWGVVGGAVGLAMSLDREDPATSGMPLRRLAFRRLRLALAAGATASLLLVTSFWWGAWTGYDSRGGLDWTGLAWGGRVILLATGIIALAGLVALAGVVRAAARARTGVRSSGPRSAARAAALALALVLGVGAVAVLTVVGLVVLAGLLLALVVVTAVEDPRPQAAPPRRIVVALAALSAAAILAMLAGSLLHVYVWNPLARMPGMTLDEIYAGLAAARELPSPVLPIAWAALWTLVALALVVLAILPQGGVRRLMTARRVAGAGILGVALVAGGSWFVGFGMGMGMADAFATSGGDAAASGPILGLIGLGYAIAAVLVGLLPSRARAVPHPAGG